MKTLLSLTQAIFGASIPVLCYHQVRPDSGMTPEKFGSHLDLIRAMGFKTISLAKLHRIVTGAEKNATPSIVITFDDCTLDNWIYAVPELLRRDMQGVFFAITNFLRPGPARPRADQGSRTCIPRFDEIMRQALQGNAEWFMNHTEVRHLVHNLGMEVYSHSAAHQACFTSSKPVGTLGDARHWSHQFLCEPNAAAHTPVYAVGSAYAYAGFGLDWTGHPLTLNSTDQRIAFCAQDFSNSKAKLEQILDQACPFLCLPWGHYDDITLKAASQTNYKMVLTLERTSVQRQSAPLQIGRLAVKDNKSKKWLAMKALTRSISAQRALFGQRAQP